MLTKIGPLLLLSIMICIFFPGCKKFQKEGYMTHAGIALTFDDDRVDNWYNYLEFFDTAQVKATFYICKYNRFTADQKNKLAILQQHGHEIAYHTTNHYNMMDYVYKYHHTTDELMKNEVTDGLKMMNRDGFYPTTFAYPYGAHNAVYDKMLMRYFKSVRALNGTNDLTKSLAPTENNDLLFGLGIDKSSKRSDAVVAHVIKSAFENNNCAVFVSHDINTGGKLSVSLDRLQKIVAYSKELGMKFYSVSEISN
ncbi:MAG: polysaccharide deacetylase family protein [Ferruginibacter sp.]|nr:polysaccharide deacetylase family protein [Ferruginibacter sp.]